MENGDGDGDSGGRRRYYAPEERTDSTNLRDFLRVKEDDISRNNSLAGLTLGAVLTGDKSPGRPQAPALTQSQSNRTLLDIIRDDPSVTKESKKSWKSFKEKLRLRRAGAGAAWTSSVPIPASDVPIQPTANRMISRRESVRFPTMDPDESTQNNESTRPQLNSVSSSRAMLLRRNTSRIPERQASRLVPTEVNISAVDDVEVNEVEEEEEGTGETPESAEEMGGGGGEQPQVRMSLMALLAETDREMGIDGGGYLMDDDEEEEEEEVESGGGGGGGEYNNCCVCMVRHKGAAFIPCGHTFCRLCSRELWVQRGNCPLCNNFILEILDIF